MRAKFVVPAAVGVVCLLLVGGYFIVKSAMEAGGPAFEASFEKSFRSSCVDAALKRPGAQEAVVRRQCDCAYDVVRPLPVSEKIALNQAGEAQTRILTEIQRRCPAR
ncbi:MAG: hypothetical protein IPK81_05415 [Rhodospirillales bacterium]|nr:hypothetical protein [Rhodospirillales bacterium]QQS13670.1 MAG: hypothetical protein IPK81_05415 [Rhodospirillales bacterium]